MADTTDNSSSVNNNESFLQNPAVITMDWVGFIVLFGSSIVLVFKLMTFKGPTSQPESYFFGYVVSNFLLIVVHHVLIVSFESNL